MIHRDLKPSNVLVTTQGGQPVPKIIDFGLARATDHRLVEATIFTEQGLIVGTPEYMSPEQAGLGALDIDTRTDVYSLGVLLYELLVGALPFPGRELRAAGLLELQRRIKEEEPPKPSTRLSGIGEESKHVAQARRTDSRRLLSRVRGDLDWITMKALEKDRTRRYGSAEALADDLRRFLDHEPVEAGPPSAAYRLKKFLRRRRGLVAAGVAVFVALIGGLVAALWQGDLARAAEAKERRPRLDEERERKRAELAEQTARENELRAKKNLVLADARLADYQRMKDAPFCADLLGEADEDLWPAHPGKVAAMDDWLRRAGKLIAHEAGHRKKLEELCGKALPPLPEVQRRIDELATLEKERDAKRARRDQAKAAAERSIGAQPQLPQLEKELSELEGQVAKLDGELRDKRWTFEDYEDRFLHSVFTDLVAKIDRLTGDDGLVARIRARRQRAATLGVRSFEDARDDWRLAIERVAKNQEYRGMAALTPQLGLVPLGPDPDSKLEEFAVLDTGEVPPRDASGKLQIDGESAIVLVLIPPGTFWMGAQRINTEKPNYDPQAEPEESPVREVTLDAYFLSKYEMTQGQWLRLMGSNPSQDSIGTVIGGRTVTAQNPVENVSWKNCQEAMRRLGLLLPTEAQWEFAGRANTQTPWWTGKEKLSLQGAANVADKYLKQNEGPTSWRYDTDLNDGYSVHGPVGRFRANAFGMHDTMGNVYEWCRDWYGSYQVKPRPGDGLRIQPELHGHPRPRARPRVLRGSGYNCLAVFTRSAARFRHPPDSSGDGYAGCRPSRSVIRQ